MPRVIVSVKDRIEAAEALQVGATWLDVKDPSSGSLGMASAKELSAIAKLNSDRDWKLSAALGELADLNEIPEDWPWERIEFVKVGMSGLANGDWGLKMDRLGHALQNKFCSLVIGVYADHVAANSPPWKACLEYAIGRQMPAILIDTFSKNGVRLMDLLDVEQIKLAIRMAHEHSIDIALAGSLDLPSVERLLDLGPSFFAARGAFCREGDRSGEFDASRIRNWLSVVQNCAN